MTRKCFNTLRQQSGHKDEEKKGRKKNVIIIKKKIIALHIQSHRTVPSFALGRPRLRNPPHLIYVLLNHVHFSAAGRLQRPRYENATRIAQESQRIDL